jgi:hypothetical protein
MADLVEAALGGPVEQRALRWLVDTGQGNVLYVRELVLGALESGAWTAAGGLWRMAGHPPVSSSLVDLVAQRMAGLSATERGPVELLAIGEPLRVGEVAGLTDYDALVAAEAVGVVVVDPAADAVRLAHPLYGEAVRGALPVLRARGLRVRVAGTLQLRDPFTPGDALRVARLLLDAGQPIPSGLLVDAARAANLAGDPELGAQLAQAALDDGAGLPAALLLARAHTVRKRFAEAEAVLAAAAGDAGPDEAGMGYLEQRAHVLFWDLDRRSEARALLDAARGWSAEPAGAGGSSRCGWPTRRSWTASRDPWTCSSRSSPTRKSTRARGAWPSGGWPWRCSSRAGPTRRSRWRPACGPPCRYAATATRWRSGCGACCASRPATTGPGATPTWRTSCAPPCAPTTTRRRGTARSAWAIRACSRAAIATPAAGSRRPSCTSSRRTHSGR